MQKLYGIIIQKMNKKTEIINFLLSKFEAIRYVAVYIDNDLEFKQREQTADSSSSQSDQYEELLTNPILLTAARQRGNIDCGGLNYMIIAYGNFYQLLKEIKGGHISICLQKDTNLNSIPEDIFRELSHTFSTLFDPH